MGTIRLALRTDKPTKKGLFPLQLIYQISGQRRYIKTPVRIFAQSWDTQNQKLVYLDKKTAKTLLPGIDYARLPLLKEVEETNATLQSLINSIGVIERRFELNSTEYTPDMVISALKAERAPLAKRDAPTDEVFHFIDQYIESHAGVREPGSLTVYRSLKNHLQDFQIAKRKKITFSNIDYAFFQEFQTFLISPHTVNRNGKKIELALNNTTAAKQLSTIKTFLNYAKRLGVSVSDKYKDFKVKKESLEVIALTSEEFERLFAMDLSTNRKMDQVRDLFCFTCVTGLRYSDLAQLKREHIKKDEIRLTVKKTKEYLSIPLSRYSIQLLSKYKEMHRPLPVISNQKLNQYIKELCQLAEINEPIEIVRFRGTKREAITYPKHALISVHTGRKTFATLSLEKGMNAEEVMAITGHKDYKSFKRYVKITEQRKKVVMQNAWGEVKLPKMKAV